MTKANKDRTITIEELKEAIRGTYQLSETYLLPVKEWDTKAVLHHLLKKLQLMDLVYEGLLHD